MKKIIIYIMIIAMLIIPNMVFAWDPTIGEPNPSVPAGIDNIALTILGVLQWCGYAIALGMIIYIGIKYTMSAANERADLKSASVNYIIGAIVIAGAATICGWCIQIFDGAGGGSGGTGGTTPSTVTGGSTGGTTAGDIWNN